MSRAASNFKEVDVKRAISAAVKAGQTVSGIRFDERGGFTILTGPVKNETAETNVSETADDLRKLI